MRSSWFDPYLWIHLAGLAAVPLWLELCFVGLALGEPLFPSALELGIITAFGALPILWMQWRAPFYIFSILVAALPPEQLSDAQRRLLPFFKGVVPRLLALAVAVGLVALLWQLDRVVPLAVPAALQWPLPQRRWFGLGMAAIAFLLVNLFTQVPVSVLRVMLVSERAVTNVAPYPIDKVAQEFTLLGLRVPRLLPRLASAPAVKADVAETD
ncbi:MAG: low-complexity tail membrane protein [Elainellaceae cyanobacterium]